MIGGQGIAQNSATPLSRTASHSNQSSWVVLLKDFSQKTQQFGETIQEAGCNSYQLRAALPEALINKADRTLHGARAFKKHHRARRPRGPRAAWWGWDGTRDFQVILTGTKITQGGTDLDYSKSCRCDFQILVAQHPRSPKMP